MLELMKFYGVSAAIAAAIAALVNFIFKAWLDHGLKRDLQRLQLNNDEALERVRSDNATALQEQRILMERLSYKQTKAHDLRLEAINAVTSRIVKLELSLNPMVGMRRISGDKAKDDAEWQRLVAEAADAYNAFMETVMYRGWCLPKETAERLERVRQAAIGGLMDIEFAKGSTSSDPKYGMDLFKKAEEAVRREIPALKKQLEEDFRQLLAAE